MKPMKEILAMPEYRIHVFAGALEKIGIENGDVNVALYYDTISQRALLYHFSNHQGVAVTNKDEIEIFDIPKFIDETPALSEEQKDILTQVYNRFIKLADKNNFERDTVITPLKYYDAESYEVLYENPEFKTQYLQDRSEMINELMSIQNILNEL